ncbi:hypothetical protein WJW27_005972, partial [Escherichia coli]
MADLRSTVDNFQNDISNITGKTKTTANNSLDNLKATANTLQNDVKTITKNNYKANVSNV